MTEFRRRTSLVLLLVAVTLATAPTYAEDSEVRRTEKLLRSKLTLVFLFEQDMPGLAKQGGGLQQLQGEIRGVLDMAPGDQGILSLLHDLKLRWAKLQIGRGEVEEALAHLAEILDAGDTGGSYQEAAQISADVYEAQAEEFVKAKDDGSALEKFALAEELCRKAGNEQHADEIAVRSYDIAAKEGIKAYDAGDYDRAFRILSKLPGRPGSRADEALAWMKENTGELTLNLLPIPKQVSGQEITGLELRLSPVRGGKEKKYRFKERFRWVTGGYDLQALGPDGKSVMSLSATVTVSGTTLDIPSRIPHGMAFIPAGGKVRRPFFIDRTEVTVSAYKNVFPGRTFKFNQSDLPAHGITFAEARQYAARVPGRKLPSYDQWQRASFGDTNMPYPWGSDGSLQRHCNVGTPKPRPVGNFEATINGYGLFDVAGNVWEWLDDQYAIGGGFGKDYLITRRVPKGWDRVVNFLKDKRPDDRLYASFKDPAMREKFNLYRIKPEMLKKGEVGFRCVLEF